MVEPQQIVYEFDPVTSIRDETGYWRLLKAESKECALGITPLPTPMGVHPLLIPLFAIGLIGMAAMTETKSNKRGKKNAHRR